MKVNDFVKLPWPSPNDEGRIVAVDNVRKQVAVSNMNMPFSGSLCKTWVPMADIKVVKRR